VYLNRSRVDCQNKHVWSLVEKKQRECETIHKSVLAFVALAAVSTREKTFCSQAATVNATFSIVQCTVLTNPLVRQ